jgi:Ca2+-binding RTX toxin-like protein
LGGFTYDLTLTDGTGIGAPLLLVDATASAVHLDASQMITTGDVVDQGIELDVGVQGSSFIGGAGSDVVVYLAAMGAQDQVDGGAGADLLILTGETDLHLHARQLQNFERLDFAGSVKMADANVAAGQTLRVMARAAFVFDGHKETDGTFSIQGNGGDDVIIGGKGADTIDASFGGQDTLTGGKGADDITGGPGMTKFVYTALSDSTRLVFDTLHGLDADDLIDLSHVDARSDKAGNQAFKLVASFTHSAGDLTLTYDAGTDTTVLAGDVDGDGKGDLVIHIAGDHTGFPGLVL